MTDAELRDAAVQEFEKTTDPYPTWVRKGSPSSSHWSKGFALLAQIHGTTPPSTGVKVAYNSTSGARHAADWPAIQAQGFNTFICGADETAALNILKSTGGNAWVSCGYWTGSGFSTTDAQAVAMLKTAVATGLVAGIYLADEPLYSQANIATIKARSQLLKNACPGVETWIAYWDASTLANWKGAVDAFALDAYPSRDGKWDYSVITKLAAAADAAGLRYYGVWGAFTDDSGDYPLPTAAELQKIIDTWATTKQSGHSCYSWGATTKVVANQLQNQPTLLDVIKAANGS